MGTLMATGKWWRATRGADHRESAQGGIKIVEVIPKEGRNGGRTVG